MKILVFSDSHGYCTNMMRAIDLETPNYLIHLGDHSADTVCLKERYPALPILSVRGNCDYLDTLTSESALAVYDGIRIFAVHGHKYGVKNGLLRLYMAAKEKAVHIALFGHTHCAYCENNNGLWLLNPGSCGCMGRSTYGLISIAEGRVLCEIRTLSEREEHHDSCD